MINITQIHTYELLPYTMTLQCFIKKDQKHHLAKKEHSMQHSAKQRWFWLNKITVLATI